MRTNHLLIYLCCVGSLWLASCSPTDTAPLVITRTVAQATDTPASTATETTAATATLLPTSTSDIATPELPSLTFTSTPDPSLPPWTREPSPTPTIEPTATVMPESIWTILFRAIPCPESWSSCNNDLFMDDYARWYLVNSDGSDLYPLEDSNTILANIWSMPYFSPDNTHLAYLARSETDDIPYLALTDTSNGNIINLGPVPEIIYELSFLSESDCVIVYTSPRPQPNELPTVAVVNVQKLCPDLSGPEILETITFPDLRPGYHHTYRLSPQNDALLAVGLNKNDIFEVYVYEFDSPHPPQLLFSAADERWWIDTVRWHSDGQHIEFFVQRTHSPDELLDIILYASDRQATHLQTVLELQLPFSIRGGSWSPDGQQLAFFPGMPHYTPATSGLYILDLETGKWQQILSGFHITGPVTTWFADIP
jgi:hypothetical protein